MDNKPARRRFRFSLPRQADPHLLCPGGIGVVFQRYFHGDIGGIDVNTLCIREDRPGGKVRLWRGEQIHMAIQTGTGVPAPGFRRGIVHYHEQAVLPAEFDIRGKVRVKRRIAVGMGFDKVSIQFYLGVHVSAVKFHDYSPPFPVRGYIKIFSIRTNTPGEKPACAAIGGIL